MAADKVLAVAALIGLALFLAVLIAYVPEPALVVVCVVTVLLAAFDFAQEAFGLRWPRRKSPG